MEDPYPTLHARFRATARHHPDRPAVIEDGRAVTYAAFDRWSDLLAERLCGERLPPRSRVCLDVAAPAAALAALLAVLKAGHAYVVVDRAWPAARRAEVASRCGGALWLVDEAGQAAGTWTGPVVKVGDGPPPDAIAPPAADHGSAADPACVYYSSGSTGHPKGVVLSHHAVVQDTLRYVSALGLEPDDRLALVAPLAYGASKSTVFGALFVGAAVLPFDPSTRGVRAFAAWVPERGITGCHMVSTLFRSWAEVVSGEEDHPRLRWVKLGGEPVLRSDVDLFLERFRPHVRLINGLGITEAAGNVCFYVLDPAAPPTAPTMPVGYAAAGVTLRVVDPAGVTVPPGHLGEIVVRCSSLADGYDGDEQTTRQRFRPAPAGEDGREFFSGDLGRMAADGCLEHAGRLDSMVKVRGHAVDLNEVERALRGMAGVRAAAVVAHESRGSLMLVAFVALEQGAPSDPPGWRTSLATVLAEQALPARFVTLAALPLLPSGKVDREALARQAAEPPAAPGKAPRLGLEGQVLRIFRQALRAPDFGATDDFFAAGGTSLAAVEVFAMIYQHLGVNLPLATLSRHPTVTSLAALIRAEAPSDAWSTAVLLTPGTSPAPFFCVPGAGCDVLTLAELARHLGRDFTFFALRFPGFDGTPIRRRSVEELAAFFLPHVRRIQPVGPYLLGGSSFGGLVAYEMARQLVRDGQPVARVVLVDTYGPGYLRLRRGLPPVRLLQAAVRWALPIGRQHVFTAANLAWGLLQHLLRASARLVQALPFPVVPPYALRFLHVQEACFHASARYAFPPYPGRLDLLRLTHQPPAALFEPSPELGWRRAHQGELVVHEVPGYHGEQLKAPYVAPLANALRACLADAVTRRPGSFAELVGRSREAWDELAPWWDERIGDEGNPASRDVLLPATERLLAARPGERILDVACGNGWLARRLARAGAEVVAFDFSERFIELARGRSADLRVSFHVLDATDQGALLSLGERSFDAAVSAMGLMDIATLDPLFAALARLLKPGGRFVFSILHPDGAARASASPLQPLTGLGLPEQPVPHLYFHRPLPVLVETARRAGLTLEACETVTAAGPGPCATPSSTFLVGLLRAPPSGAA